MQKLSCLITLCSVLLVSNSSLAQCSLVTAAFEDLLAPGTTIVEARVKSTASFWGSAGEMIYTRYELEVYQVFKGNAGRSVDLIALGGVVGDVAVKVAPSTACPELTGRLCNRWCHKALWSLMIPLLKRPIL